VARIEKNRLIGVDRRLKMLMPDFLSIL